MNRCKLCGLNMDLVGVRHNCDPARLTSGLKITAAKKSTEPVGDGVMLTSMSHPMGLLNELAGAIKDGRLNLSKGCQCKCCVERRQKQLEAQKRYREKKNAG